MLERFIEQKLVARVRREGGLCPKFVSPGSDGWPDRLVLMPGGKIAFVELKAPQGRLRPLQVQRHAQLRDLGFLVFTVNDPEQIPEILSSGKREKAGSMVPARGLILWDVFY